MEIFNLQYPFKDSQILQKPVVLAMGFFDGVHLGHQKLLKEAKKIAQQKNVPLALLTYNHHPKIVFQKIPVQYQYVGSKERKYELLEEYGVDFVYEFAFTSKLASLGPKLFVDNVLTRLNPLAVVAGVDHTYGPKETANMTLLPKYVEGEFDVVAVEQLNFEDHKVGSTKIREFLDSGNVICANKLLGYEYQTNGLVVHGEAIGRTLGFPTANVLTPNDQIVPGVGVYAVEIKINGVWHQGAASVGYNQTLGENRPKTLEIYIFNFHEEIYGETVEVKWHKRTRNMEKFAGLEDLIEQLKQDELDVLDFFENK